MDIKRPFSVNLQTAIDKNGDAELNLKLNQVVDAKVIETRTMLNTLTLKINDKTIEAETEPPIDLKPGQTLQLQVVKLLPTPELKILISGVDQMDIKLPLSVNLQTAINKTGDSGLNLKLNQVVEAKVIENQTMLDTLTLKINDKTVKAEAEPAIDLKPGQALQLQVVKLLPTPELKVLSTLLARSAGAGSALNSDQLTLRLLNPAIMPSPVAGKSTPTTPLPQLADNLRLQATVISIAGDKITIRFTPTAPPSSTGSTPLPNSTLLTLDSKQLLVNGNSPSAVTLKEGAQIQLQVVRTGNTPVFLVETLENNADQKVIDAIKQLLPIATSGLPLLNELQQLLPRLQADASVAETLKNLAQEILRNLPSGTHLAEAPELKKAFSDSGLFLESKLAALLSGKPDVALQNDFKLKLSKLMQLLSLELAHRADKESSDTLDTLKASLHKAQSALAGLTLEQLNSLPKDESPKQSWMVELPFFNNRQADTVKIAIEQGKTNADEQTQKNWAVSITITPPDLGTIHCRISCYDGSVNTRFWSEAADTVEKINAHLDYLKQQFEKKGLSPGFMEAHQGQPSPSDSIKTAIPHLLSEKA